ncbi:MAG: ABC transporter ATP-binding protein [Lachnospiraceae bacterium]|nr:ABC transporter ATP-binding protein [Lachnospiraceae bacterium]
MNNDIILEVNNLNSYYEQRGRHGRNRKREQVLHDVSFSIHEGDILGLVGESGSGKTTLAKVLLGIVNDYDGEVIHHTSYPQMVFQDPYSSLNPARTVRWILEEPLRALAKRSKEGWIPRTKSARSEMVRQMLSEVGLDDEYLDRKPGDLSGGQRQRISIAGAVITRPKLIIADEPVSALDVTIQAQILELMQKLKETYSLSYLFISHDLNVVYQICSRVMVMQHGSVVESGDTESVYNHPQHPYTQVLLMDAM